MNQVLAEHEGDVEREFVEALKQNNIVQNSYHEGLRVANHCMCLAQNGDKIVDAMMKVIEPKIRDPMNCRYAAYVSAKTKVILKLWYT